MIVKNYSIKSALKFLNGNNNLIKVWQTSKNRTNHQAFKEYCNLEISLVELETFHYLNMPVMLKYLKDKFLYWNAEILQLECNFQQQKVNILRNIYSTIKSEVFKNFALDLMINDGYNNLKHTYNRKLINAYNRLNKLTLELKNEKS